MKKLVIIPARGGSKRTPRKNIKTFFGKPILAYSLHSAMNSGIFDCIHVSTEDKEIYNIASALGFPPTFYRSVDASKDHIPVKDVLIESVQEFEKYGENFDIICLLSATAPLITDRELKEAYIQFERSAFKYPLIAVARYPVPIEWAMKRNVDTGIIEPLNNNLFFESSHNFQDKYYDVGNFAFFTKQQLFSKTNEIKFLPHVLPMTKSIDVDNLEDWEMLEKLYFAHNDAVRL